MTSNTPNKPKTLSSKIVFQSKFFHINHVEIEKDGHVVKKDIIEKIPFVIIIPYTKTNDIYMELQYRDAHGKELLEVIAGHIDPGEEPLQAAKRELQEEAGLTAKVWKQIAHWELASNMKQEIYVFACSDLEEGEQHLEQDESIQIVKFPIADVLGKIDTGEMTIANHIAAVLLFEKLRKEGKF